jgi:hypothetical protein
MRATAMLLAACLVAAPVLPAHADDAPPADTRTEAERLLDEATRLFSDEADYAAALELFWRSYRLAPSALALKGIAVVQELQGLYVDAHQTLARLLDEFGATLTERQRATLQNRLDRMRARIGAIEVRVAQPGARVLVDGREIGRGPVRAATLVMPGAHTVLATLPGHDPWTQTRTIAAGATESLTIELRRTPVRVERPDLVHPMPPWIPWLTVATGMVLVGSGFVAQSAYRDDLERARDIQRERAADQRPVATDDIPAFQQAEIERAAAISLWAVGGAALATGVALAIFNQPRPRADAPRIVPTGRGVALQLSF